MIEMNVGLIGADDVGQAHALAFKNAVLTFGLEPAVPRLVAVYDVARRRAAVAAERFGIGRNVGDWREIVSDPGIELVVIACCDDGTPEIVEAAIAQGKHVLCERIPSFDHRQMRALAEAADAAGVRAAVCFPGLRNPVQTLARTLVSSGKLGSVRGVRVSFEKDTGPDSGVVAPLHRFAADAIALGLDLIGPIRRVCGMSKRFARAEENSSSEAPGTGDLVQFLCEFDHGAVSHFSIGNVCTGRLFGLAYEVQGTLGAICFDQERMNELEYFRQDEPLEIRGYKTIYSGPSQADYAAIHPLPGVGLSFNDQRTFEVRAMVTSIRQVRRPDYDFHFAANIRRVEQAIMRSIEMRGWTALSEIS